MRNSKIILYALVALFSMLMGEVKAAEFIYPKIPGMITDMEARKDYLAEHFWDNYDFKDKELIENDSLSGIAVVTYMQLLQQRSNQVVASSVSQTLTNCLERNPSYLKGFVSLLERYMYDPNSPVRNEELFIPVARFMVEDSPLSGVEKSRYRYQLDMLLKNRKGEVATDFSYTLKDGETRVMHGIKTPYTILFFNNPDCEDCMRVKQLIAKSKIINTLYDWSVITILAVYSEDDVPLWRETKYPDIMVNGYDKDMSIIEDELYDLKAMPTLYLLDAQKRVVLKDVSFEVLERYLSKH